MGWTTQAPLPVCVTHLVFSVGQHTYDAKLNKSKAFRKNCLPVIHNYPTCRKNKLRAHFIIILNDYLMFGKAKVNINIILYTAILILVKIA
jgi:hypothetical protein